MHGTLRISLRQGANITLIDNENTSKLLFKL